MLRTRMTSSSRKHTDGAVGQTIRLVADIASGYFDIAHVVGGLDGAIFLLSQGDSRRAEDYAQERE